MNTNFHEMATSNSDNQADKMAAHISNIKDVSNDNTQISKGKVAKAILDTINETTGTVKIDEYLTFDDCIFSIIKIKVIRVGSSLLFFSGFLHKN